jgi:hypothetical protein
MLATASRHRGLFFGGARHRDSRFKERLFRRDAETNTRDACATRTNSNEPYWAISHTSFLQLRESDLYGRGRIAQLSFFFLRRSFFALTCRKSAVTDRRYRATRMRWTGQIFWLLAFEEVESQFSTGLHLLPRLHPRNSGDWPIGKSYPVTAAQLLPILTGFLAPIHFFQARKELGPEVAACAWRFKIYLSTRNKSSCGFD